MRQVVEEASRQFSLAMSEHAPEDELVFIEPPSDYIAEKGDCLWQALRKIYGRRSAARGWQDHFCEAREVSGQPHSGLVPP